MISISLLNILILITTVFFALIVLKLYKSQPKEILSHIDESFRFFLEDINFMKVIIFLLSIVLAAAVYYPLIQGVVVVYALHAQKNVNRKISLSIKNLPLEDNSEIYIAISRDFKKSWFYLPVIDTLIFPLILIFTLIGSLSFAVLFNQFISEPILPLPNTFVAYGISALLGTVFAALIIWTFLISFKGSSYAIIFDYILEFRRQKLPRSKEHFLRFVKNNLKDTDLYRAYYKRKFLPIMFLLGVVLPAGSALLFVNSHVRIESHSLAYSNPLNLKFEKTPLSETTAQVVEPINGEGLNTLVIFTPSRRIEIPGNSITVYGIDNTLNEFSELINAK